jgi:hypothetical protein
MIPDLNLDQLRDLCCNLDADIIRALLLKASHLHELYLNYLDSRVSEVLEAIFELGKELTTLHLGGEETAFELSKRDSLLNLTYLELRFNSLTNADLFKLLERTPNLRFLSISLADSKKLNFSALEQMPEMRQLEQLSVEYTSTDNFLSATIDRQTLLNKLPNLKKENLGILN